MVKATQKRFLAAMVSVFMMLSVFMPMNTYAAETKTEAAKVEKVTEVKPAEVKKVEVKENALPKDTAKTIEIISINDFHGNLAEEPGEKGQNAGMSKIISAVKDYQAKNKNTIVVSGGDSYQGTAMSNLSYGAPVSEMYKQMGVVVSAVGNHEFDWGIQRVEKWAKDGGFDFLAANIVDKKTGKPVTWAKPYKVIEKDGMKIAFVGLTTRETAFTTLKDNVKDYDFADLKVTAEKWANDLKAGKLPEGKVDLVIALTHVDSFQDKETKVITGDVVDSGLCDVKSIDAIISAHSHQAVAGMVKDMPVVQGYKNGRALGKLTIALDKKGKNLGIIPEVDMLGKRKSEIIADPTAQTVFEKANKELEPILNEVVGTTKEGFAHERKSSGGTTALGYWVSDVMRKEAKVQIGLMNEGGLRREIPAGNITMGILYEVMPFDNTLVTLEVPGSQLKKIVENGIQNPDIGWVEVAGLKATYDMSKPFGSRLIDLCLEDGTKVEDAKMYTVVTNDFMSTGGDKYDFTGSKNMVNTMIPIRDIIAKYIKDNKTVDIKFTQPLTDKTPAGAMPAKEAPVKEAPTEVKKAA